MAKKKSAKKVDVTEDMAKKFAVSANKAGIVVTNKNGKGWRTKRKEAVAWLKQQTSQRKTDKGTVGVYWSLANLKMVAAAFAIKYPNKVARKDRKDKSPYSPYKRKKQKTASKSSKGLVMGHRQIIYVVVQDKGSQEKVLGSYPNKTSAKSAARTLLSSIRMAYNSFIPNDEGALKINAWSKAAEPEISFDHNKAWKYLTNNKIISRITSTKKPFSIKVLKINLAGNSLKDKKYKAYFELYNSPVYGNLRWNPKKRR